MSRSIGLAFALSIALLGTNLPGAPVEYSHRIWRTQEGLPQNQVRVIAQTPDGYLWIGTSGGLVRFDGVRFTIFDRSSTPAFHDDSVVSLLPARDHSLWIGTEGGGLIHLRDGLFQSFGTKEGLTNLFVRALLQDKTGVLWVGTDRGLFRYSGGKLKRFDGTPEFPLVSALTMAEADGRIWFGGVLGLFYEENGRLFRHGYTGEIRSIHRARDGTLWFATAGPVRYMSPRATNRLELAIAEPLRNVNGRVISEDSDGNLWIGTLGEGLVRFRDGAIETYHDEDFLPDNSVFTLLEDLEHNFWVGTQDGLLRLSKTLVTSITTKNGLPANNISTTYQDPEDRLLVATVTGKLEEIRGERAFPFEPATPKSPGSLRDVRFYGIYEEPRGTTWLATLNHGIGRVADGKTTFFTTADGLRSDQVRQFLQAGNGDLWAATGSGLLLWEDGTFRTFYLEQGLAYGGVRVLMELHHGPHAGDVLVGTDGGLNRVHQRQIVSEPAFTPLKGEKVWSLLEDRNGDIWIGTRGGGLVRLRGDQLAKLTTRNGLLSNSVYQILADDRHRIWMSGPAGISATALEELNRVADGKQQAVAILPYGTAEGLESLEMKGGWQPAGTRASDGSLWFPSTKGAIRIQPGQIRPGTTPPVLIESLLADESPLPIAKVTEIPAGRRKLEIHFTACALRSPERITFQYKLDGFDDRWIRASNQRVALYSNLQPGTYRFRVLARDVTAGDKTSEAFIDFNWRPQTHQTWWFQAICVLLGAALIWGAFFFYAAQTRSRYALLLAERTRLARELHDTIIQGCIGVSTLLEAAESLEQSHSAQAKKLVEHARIQVRETIEEAREAVWDLRHHSNHGELAGNLLDFAQRLGEEKHVNVNVQLSGSPQPLEPDTDKTLFLVAREAIRNAASHGSPKEIGVRLSFHPKQVALEVTDDGSGFDPGASKGPEQGHFGILGMQERIQKLGGTFRIRSSPGEGATVSIAVPMDGKGEKEERQENMMSTQDE